MNKQKPDAQAKQPREDKVVITVPAQALEEAAAPLATTPTHMPEVFTPAAAGRNDAFPCTRRQAWSARTHVVVRLLRPNDSPAAA